MPQQQVFFASSAFLPRLCFQALTNPVSRKPFLFTSMQKPRGVPSAFLFWFRLQRLPVLCVPLFLLAPVFSATCRLFFSLCALFAHPRLCFQRLAASFAKTPGGMGGQRGRGRNGGRAVSGRGRMRKRGPSGGGTFRRESPQHGQRPSSQNARVASARSHWPRASHCGLMHCTVKPGRNCISFSLTAVTPFAATARSETRMPL